MNLTPKEDEEQIAFVQWLEWKRIPFMCVPSSTWTQSWNQKRKNYAMGVRKGFPDLIVFLPKKNILLFIEMKRKKGGVVSIEQKEWLERLDTVEGCYSTVAKGYDEAVAFVEKFL